MRERSRDKGRLEDIVFYANNVMKILDGVSYEDFVNDIRIYYSVMKNIEIIGEAARMLSNEFKSSHTEIPWRAISNMRNFLVHEYFNVDSNTVWEVIHSDIVFLKKWVVSYLNSL